MTEERIKELTNKKLQELDISGKYMQPDDWSTLRVWAEDFAATVAAEAREEGIEKMRCKTIPALSGIRPKYLLRAYRKNINTIAKRLKDKRSDETIS